MQEENDTAEFLILPSFVALSSVASFRWCKQGYKFLVIFFLCSMLIENVFRGGAMRRATLSVRSAIRCTIILFSCPLHFVMSSNIFEGEKHKLSNYYFFFNICKTAAIWAWLYSTAPFVLLWSYSNELQVYLYFPVCVLQSWFPRFFLGLWFLFFNNNSLIGLEFSSPEEIGIYPEGTCTILHL